MKFNNEHFKLMMEKLEFPAVAVETFTYINDMLERDNAWGSRFKALIDEYMYPEADGLEVVLPKVDAFADEFEIDRRTMNLLFFLHCAEIMHQRYPEAGISDEYFWESAKDFKYKLLECMDCCLIPGNDTGGWHRGFLELWRVGVGRFQYEDSEYDGEDVTLKSGFVLKKGRKMLGFHIPSSGVPLTDEVRLASYRKIYSLVKNSKYADEYIDENGYLLFCCGSWLLHKAHYEFLPKHLNILKFMDDFEILRSSEKDNFSNDWRVYGKYARLAPEAWPEDTSLRKAYKQWILSGGKAGDGWGVILFDGENIVR